MYMYGCLTFGKHPYMVLRLLAYLYDAQRMSSRTVGFLPYMNMPTRYILAAIHTINMNEIYSRTREVMISHDGIPNGMRTIKRLGRSVKEGYYRLIPTNKEYDEQEIPINKIALVYRVMGTMKSF